MITAKVDMQITIDSSQRQGTDDLKKGLIINGETGEIEQFDDKTGALETGGYRTDLLKRADSVIDTVTISSRETRLLPSRGLHKAA